jgi:hypothetical protein
MRTWQIYINEKPAMYSFTKWIDCIIILAKLHRLGVNAIMKKVEK